ncbi:hypothetical protein NQ317_005151 [Molorchus minor]|uniref:THAP-type domain-containing protein n=1 Tax=Molorchus minor TaxID=1323400 RepID=A0ABQ9K1W6_9CUCU|nr:hypothetical protein NQ317_005151 [Molorchus minor]
MENKWCFVPGCKNTSKNAPKKLFVTVPRQMPRKIKWFKAARRDLPKTKAIFFCCEDHFNNQMHTYFAAFEPLTSAILNLLSRFINSATIKTSTAGKFPEVAFTKPLPAISTIESINKLNDERIKPRKTQ